MVGDGRRTEAHLAHSNQYSGRASGILLPVLLCLLPVLPPAIQASSLPREFCRVQLHLSTMSDSSVRSAAGQEAPAAKKQRKFTEAELGGPIEDEETAREKLKEVGFDPENIHEIKLMLIPYEEDMWWDVNPICYFSAKGDLKMCRYLVTRGATTRESASVEYESGEIIEWFPMLAAASHGMKDVCEWLYHHGASADISRVVNDYDDSPLINALFPWLHPYRDLETARWLILHGAIPEDREGNPCATFMSTAFETFDNTVRINERKRLLRWAENVCGDHESFTTFLHGTHPRISDKERRLSPARFLEGNEGIRKKIAGYAGVLTGRNLRRVRGIVEPLKKALEQAEKI